MQQVDELLPAAEAACPGRLYGSGLEIGRKDVLQWQTVVDFDQQCGEKMRGSSAIG